MELFGHLERFLSETLYPYRVPVTLALVLMAAVGGWFAWRRGWLGRARRAAATRPLASAVLAVLVLAVVLPSGYYLLSPLWTRTTLVEDSPLAVATAEATAATASPTAVVMADSAAASPTPSPEMAFQPRTVLEGEWLGADDFHFAEGRALIIESEPGKYVLRVEDFSVRNGPDLFVYVSPDPAGYTEAAVNLGELKATDGAFNYEIPQDVSLDSIRSVVVWCRQFAVLFGTAALE